MTVEAPVLVTCECGARFTLSARNARQARRRGRSPICPECRHPAKPPTDAQIARYRRYWLQRFTVDELLELGHMLGWC